MIVESLRYWVTDYHIDGFRFDLAAILGRDQNGNPMSKPPLLESYNSRHNEANGEGNRDGENHNNSWNCGWLARKLS